MKEEEEEEVEEEEEEERHSRVLCSRGQSRKARIGEFLKREEGEEERKGS